MGCFSVISFLSLKDGKKKALTRVRRVMREIIQEGEGIKRKKVWQYYFCLRLLVLRLL